MWRSTSWKRKETQACSAFQTSTGAKRRSAIPSARYGSFRRSQARWGVERR